MAGVLLLSLVLILFGSSCSAYSFLFLTADAGSHIIIQSRLACKLTERGHSALIVISEAMAAKIPKEVLDSTKSCRIELDNYTAPEPITYENEEFTSAVRQNAFERSFLSQLRMLRLVSQINSKPGVRLMQDLKWRKRLEGIHLDFIFVDSVYIGFPMYPYMRGIPYAVIAAECPRWQRRIPALPSHVPIPLTPFTDQMTFFERLENAILTALSVVLDHLGVDDVAMYVPNRPRKSYGQLLNEASLCLSHRHHLIDFVRPMMPDSLSLAPALMKDARPLVGDLKKHVEDAAERLILVSFGSWLKDLPMEELVKLMKSFSNVRMKFIFAFRGQLPDAPRNVVVQPWVPVNDVLGHPNCKLFISHCGYTSMIEAAYHGIPVVGLPYSLDQIGNVAVMKQRGFAEEINIASFTSEELTGTINKVLSNKSYTLNARRVSQMLHELKDSKVADPVFWIEHVVKYGKDHLRSGANDLNLVQYMMLDLLAFIVSVVVLLILFLYFLCRFIARSCQHKVKRE